MLNISPQNVLPPSGIQFKRIGATDNDLQIDPEERVPAVDVPFGLGLSKPAFGIRATCLPWFLPGCLLFVCFVMQNFGLYIGTYYYVLWMDRLVVKLGVSANHGLAHQPIRSLRGSSEDVDSGSLSKSELARSIWGSAPLPTSVQASLEASQHSTSPSLKQNKTGSKSHTDRKDKRDDGSNDEDSVHRERSSSSDGIPSTPLQPKKMSRVNRNSASDDRQDDRGNENDSHEEEDVFKKRGNHSIFLDGLLTPTVELSTSRKPQTVLVPQGTLTTSESAKESGNDTVKIASVGEHLSSEVSQGSLQDVVADLLGRTAVPTQMLDYLSGAVPMAVFIISILSKDLRVWAKCCLCAALLALLKGFLAWATVVPDSIGWDGCQARLGPDGLAFFRNKNGLNFETELFTSLCDVLVLEILGIPGKSHIRFCADMMFSGHTYVSGIFSLGLYDLCRSQTATMARWKRAMLRFIVGAMLLAFVGLDVLLILMNRFHYTMDCVVAIVLVLLLFSNTAIAVVVETYVLRWEKAPTGSPDLAGSGEKDLGTVLVPPCCLPLCFYVGRYHLHNRPDLAERFNHECSDLFDEYELKMRRVNEQLTDQRRSHDEELSRNRDDMMKIDQDLRLRRQEESKMRAQEHTLKMEKLQVENDIKVVKNKVSILEKDLAAVESRVKKAKENVDEQEKEKALLLRQSIEEETNNPEHDAKNELSVNVSTSQEDADQKAEDVIEETSTQAQPTNVQSSSSSRNDCVEQHEQDPGNGSEGMHPSNEPLPVTEDAEQTEERQDAPGETALIGDARNIDMASSKNDQIEQQDQDTEVMNERLEEQTPTSRFATAGMASSSKPDHPDHHTQAKAAEEVRALRDPFPTKDSIGAGTHSSTAESHDHPPINPFD